MSELAGPHSYLAGAADLRGLTSRPPADILELLIGVEEELHSGGLEPRIYVSEYPYGSLIVERGNFKAPCESEACEACGDLQRTAPGIPLVLVLKGSVEVFRERITRHGSVGVPLRMLRDGEFFGVFEGLDSVLTPDFEQRAPWSVSSGARSIAVLSPLDDKRARMEAQKLLGKYISEVAWGNLVSVDRKLIQYLAQARESKWRTTLATFSRDWLAGAGPASKELQHRLLQVAWEQSRPLRSFAAEDEILRAFWQQRVPLNTTLGELFYIGVLRDFADISRGDRPAMRPSTQCGYSAGPFEEMQDLLQEILAAIRPDWYPVILQPSHLKKAGDLGYYSLSSSHHYYGLGATELQRAKRSQVKALLEPLESALALLAEENLDMFEKLDIENLLLYGKGKDKLGSRFLKNVAAFDFDGLLPSGPDSVQYEISHKSNFFTACAKLIRC